MNEMSGMPHSTSMPDISFMLRMTKCVLYSLNVMFTFSFKFIIIKIETDIFSDIYIHDARILEFIKNND